MREEGKEGERERERVCVCVCERDCFSSTPDKDCVSKALVFLIVLYLSSYR